MGLTLGVLVTAARGEAPTAELPAGATEVVADRISGQNEVETTAEGNVEFRRDNIFISADRVIYRQLDDEAEAQGNVYLKRNEDVISGPHLKLKIQDNLGFFEHPSFVFRHLPPPDQETGAQLQPVLGSGDAERIDFAGEGQYRLSKGSFSTCSPNRDWYLTADNMELDYVRETGTADDAKVVFMDTPIFYWPWLSFSLNDRRKSGFLSPTYGTNTTSGLEIGVPWYWNIAPNMDATITPRFMTRRGLQLNAEFRYLDYTYNGLSRFEYLPRDQLAGKDRHAYALQHNQAFGNGWSGDLNLNGVSDDSYFAELSSRVTTVSQANLLRQGRLIYTASWWNAILMMQRYQTLQDPDAPVAIPYQRLPQLTVNGSRSDLPGEMNFSFAGEFVDFHHPSRVLAKRTVLYPQLSWPLLTSALYVTPKLGVHYTNYQLERQGDSVPANQSRTVPIFNIDSGVVFERDAHLFDRDLIQTAEPRLYYLYIPERDQTQIPVFDSGATDFNFAQIFGENRYSGSDRLGDANQLTAALTSRFIDPATGAELARAAIGQRYYFQDQQVTLPSETARTKRKTDLLAAFSARLHSRLHVDAGWQYSPFYSRSERVNVGLRYQPDFGRTLNASYRYTHDQIEQVDLSTQWPIYGGWYGVGRYNYSLRDRRLVEGVAGLEYDAGCWVARIVLHRLATTTTATSTSFYIQLELNGLARIGSNPLDMLKRNIAGYGIINQPTADPAFGDN